MQADRFEFQRNDAWSLLIRMRMFHRHSG
jgi:hypothetical protein